MNEEEISRPRRFITAHFSEEERTPPLIGCAPSFEEQLTRGHNLARSPSAAIKTFEGS